MSFIIKCNKCGGEQEFTSNSKRFEENISIDIYVRGTYMGEVVESIEIECENINCNNAIEIKY